MRLNEAAGVCLDLLGAGLTVDEAAARLESEGRTSRSEARISLIEVRRAAIDNEWLVERPPSSAVDELELNWSWDKRGGVLEAIARLLAERPVPTVALEHHRVGLLFEDLADRTGLEGRDILTRRAQQEPEVVATHIVVLGRARSIVEQPVVVLKGLEVASRYPSSTLRGSGDIDLFFEHPVDAFERLVSAGWRRVDYVASYDRHHHLAPLVEPETGVLVEVHRRPTWLPELPTVQTSALLGTVQPSAVGLNGVWAPDAAHQALLMAAHSWKHRPIATLRDLIDVALLMPDAMALDVDSLAATFGMRRMWWVWKRLIRGLEEGDWRVPTALVPVRNRLRSLDDTPPARRYIERALGGIAVATPRGAVRLVVSNFDRHRSW